MTAGSHLLISVVFGFMSASAVAGESAKSDGRSASELYAFSKTLLSGGHPEAALPFLEAVISIQPANADAYELLGDAFVMSGRDDKAVETYEKFLAVAPPLDPRAAELNRFIELHRHADPVPSA
jgi:tetratricopeptide (TPR) repeat protein